MRLRCGCKFSVRTSLLLSLSLDQPFSLTGKEKMARLTNATASALKLYGLRFKRDEPYIRIVIDWHEDGKSVSAKVMNSQHVASGGFMFEGDAVETVLVQGKVAGTEGEALALLFEKVESELDVAERPAAMREALAGSEE